jgi:hypothetical protein
MPKKEAGDERERREHEERARHEHERREHEPHQHEGHEPEHGYEGREGEHEPPQRRRMGREHAVHRQIIERRLGGGAPATPEAYAKGLEEWNKLPGSIVRPATDEKPATRLKTDASDEEDKEHRS